MLQISELHVVLLIKSLNINSHFHTNSLAAETLFSTMGDLKIFLDLLNDVESVFL